MENRPSTIDHRPLRIALDVSQMVYHGHGVGRYTEELARALLKLEQESVQFTYFAGALKQMGQFQLRRHKKPWSKATWRLVSLSPRLANWAFNYFNLPVEWYVGKQDLFHASDWTQPRAKCPVVTTVHDLAFHHHPETVHKRVLRTQKRRLQRAVKNGSYFIADSESTKNDLVKIYRLPKSQITVVYPGIGVEFEPQNNNKIKQVKIKYNLPDQYLLSLGTREPRKNLDRLIQAVQQLQQVEPATPPLVIAGRFGWGKENKVEGVQVTGFVDESDLPALYSGASAFVYPSLYEGFGFPVLEAMACGAPVVTSNLSSLPEVAGEAAVLVDPLSVNSIASGINLALKNRKSLVTKGKKQAAKFSWEATAKQTLAVYTGILENRKTGGLN